MGHIILSRLASACSNLNSALLAQAWQAYHIRPSEIKIKCQIIAYRFKPV